MYQAGYQLLIEWEVKCRANAYLPWQRFRFGKPKKSKVNCFKWGRTVIQINGACQAGGLNSDMQTMFWLEIGPKNDIRWAESLLCCTYYVCKTYVIAHFMAHLCLTVQYILKAIWIASPTSSSVGPADNEPVCLLGATEQLPVSRLFLQSTALSNICLALTNWANWLY